MDRREFLKSACVSVAAGSAHVALGGTTDLLSAIPRPVLTASPAAWPPLAQGRAFEIVALGDSIMWGQGLSDDPSKNQKFTHKVQRFIQEKLPDTEVHLHNFAHSGAQILAHETRDEEPATHGEIPNNFPSITSQVSTAIRELDGRSARRYVPRLHPPVSRESVALVLLDGGINDLGTKKILTPDPTVGASWVREHTRKQTVARMEKLLTLALTNFPNAKIVVTNYFQIVSEHSDPVYLWELLRVWDIIGPTLEVSQEWLLDKLARQSFAFHDESTKGFREAVANARPPQLVANRRVAEPSRVALAEIPFAPRNAYGAPDSLLFYLNEPDPAMGLRRQVCMDHYGVLNPNCTLAAGGHPNIRGAEIYANAIIKALKQLEPDWSTQPKLDVTRTPIRRP